MKIIWVFLSHIFTAFLFEKVCEIDITASVMKISSNPRKTKGKVLKLY